jgi:SsrA-binding protein
VSARSNKSKGGPDALATNRKARRDYQVLEKIEAGIELQGTEVKSLRDSKCSLEQSHGRIENGELWLYDFNILAYEYGNIHNHNPSRPKRLLLHKREIVKLDAKLKTRGLTIVPLRVYLKHRRVKVEIGLCKGKNLHDKRETLKRKTADMEAKRAMARY